MKLYLQILIIGILIFSSKQQYTCRISAQSRQNDGFYNEPTGSGGICTNTGTCYGSFTERPNQPKSRPTLTGDCFHCSRANRYLDRLQSVQGLRCGTYCLNGYTDSNDGSAPSYPLKGYCQYCVKGLVLRNGACVCQNQNEILINSYSGICGSKCDYGYVQYRNGIHLPDQYSHCLHCHYRLVNRNGYCQCPNDGQYLTKGGYSYCGNQCQTKFTHKSDGSPPDSPATGHCLNCISGHTYYQGECYQSCPSGQYYINFTPTCGTSCELGYSYKAFQKKPPNTPIQDNCGKCLLGLTKSIYGCHCRVTNQHLTNTVSNRCGRTCEFGYTHNSDGSAPDSTRSTGHCLYCLRGFSLNINGACV